MIQALVRKEVRELAAIVGAGLVMYLVLVAACVGVPPFANWLRSRSEVPFQRPTVHPLYIWVAAGLALALGFRQSAWEAAQGTYLFLLHRPMRRDAIFLIKLAAGTGLFVVATCAPILLYAWWAALPGHHASPFDWSVTTATWRVYLSMPLLYLGAFLSGLRPARWYGTRLLPLAACGLLVAFLASLPWWWLVGMPLTLLVYALLVTTICHVGRTREYA
jgi:hypothetical protein